ncbi:MAG TPA: nucleotidyltransferase domain-containing protein [Bacteroidales bacterium]|nr:nucleotidyltransferase domain-containing protein [Bacteroidales bacterium]HUX55479.1 nucleotidyltransferase domain-containing protein [Bacteroidales bacterium]
MESDTFLNIITKAIHSKDPRAEAFLFGSRARGDFRPDSDWDILILVDSLNVTNEIDDKFRDELYKIEIESGQIISTFVYSKDYWQKNLIFSPLYKNIKKEGIQL